NGPTRAHSAHDGHSLHREASPVSKRLVGPLLTRLTRPCAGRFRSGPLADSRPIRSHADVLICPLQESQPKSPKAAAPILLLQAASLGAKALQGGFRCPLLSFVQPPRGSYPSSPSRGRSATP